MSLTFWLAEPDTDNFFYVLFKNKHLLCLIYCCRQTVSWLLELVLCCSGELDPDILLLVINSKLVWHTLSMWGSLHITSPSIIRHSPYWWAWSCASRQHGQRCKYYVYYMDHYGFSVYLNVRITTWMDQGGNAWWVWNWRRHQYPIVGCWYGYSWNGAHKNGRNIVEGGEEGVCWLIYINN